MSETGQGMDIRRLMFTARSYTPIPFLLVMIVFARPTLASLVWGGMMVLLGEGLRFWGVSIAGSETRTTGRVGGTYLITSGPFAFVRNPLYVGNLLLYGGIGIMSLALFPWLFIAAVAWFSVQYYLIVTQEEEYLLQEFGDAYTHYRAHVPRFVPRITPYRDPAPAPKARDFGEGLSSERRTLQALVIVTGLLVALFLLRN